MPRALVKFDDYTREEVHDLFSPRTPFTPQSGAWGLQGIVSIPYRPSDYVFFVTYGQKQGGHEFDEGVTEEGVLTWQSQPKQRLTDRQILELINHNEDTSSIYLFLRTDFLRVESLTFGATISVAAGALRVLITREDGVKVSRVVSMTLAEEDEVVQVEARLRDALHPSPLISLAAAARILWKEIGREPKV